MALIILLFLALYVWFGVRILQKAGLSPLWAIALVVPIVNIVMIWVFAFSRWPALDDRLPPAPPDSSFTS